MVWQIKNKKGEKKQNEIKSSKKINKSTKEVKKGGGDFTGARASGGDEHRMIREVGHRDTNVPRGTPGSHGGTKQDTRQGKQKGERFTSSHQSNYGKALGTFYAKKRLG